MKLQRIRTVAKQVGLWLMLLGVTALFTVLFNFLGTITVAVFAAVAMGVRRRWEWRTIPVSLAFLLVGLALTHVAKAGLDLRQRISMAGLSFGAFWMTYFLSLGLMCLEKKTDPEPGPVASTPLPASGVPEGSADVNGHAITLGDLQGTWRNDPSGSAPPTQALLMDIGGDRFVVRVLNPEGTGRVLVQGKLEFEEKDPGVGEKGKAHTA